MKRFGVVAAALAATFITAAVPAHASPARPHAPAGALPPRPAAWIISQKALSLLDQAGLTQREQRVVFGGNRTFLVGTGGAGLTVSGSVRTVTFTSYAALRKAVLGNTLPRGTRAVLYDNEAWPLTPPNEQLHPARYEALAAGIVHARHLLFVSTPATDLARVLAPGDPRAYAAYLRLGLAAGAARHADVIDIQAQGSERDLTTYVSFIRAAAAQAREANPHVLVLAGISTNPSGQHVTSAEFTAAFQAARPYVDGFWLNVPAAGPACPRCGTPQPQVALPLLRTLSAGRLWAAI